jgi:hypothetical protein
VQYGLAAAANRLGILTLSDRLTLTVAGTELRLRYYLNNAGTGYWSKRWLRVVPVRVA